MKILKETYLHIITFFVNNSNTEQGGILGSSNGEIVDLFFPDTQPDKRTRNLYEPNVMVLNRELEKWDTMGIRFCGIIHSHLTDTPVLSLTDKNYIESILAVMMENSSLWFPIVLYKNNEVKIIVYKVEKDRNYTLKYILEELYIENEKQGVIW